MDSTPSSQSGTLSESDPPLWMNTTLCDAERKRASIFFFLTKEKKGFLGRESA